MLVSSHDHQLIQTVCNRVFDSTEDGRLIDRKLTYDEYLERQKEQQLSAACPHPLTQE